MPAQQSMTPAIPPRETRGPAPCSFAQRRLWFLERLVPESGSAYHVTAAFTVDGAFDMCAFRSALAAVVDRQAALRTRIVAIDGTPCQLVDDHIDLPIQVVSLVGHEATTASVRELLRDDDARPFDLAAGPPFRVLIVRLAPERQLIAFCLSHLVSDSWSLGILFDELDQHYAAARRGESFVAAPLPVQYTDYAAWEREQVGQAAVQAELDRMADELASAPPALALPFDRPRPEIQQFRGRRLVVPVPSQLASAVAATARSCGGAASACYLAAFHALLGRWSGQDDVVVGIPVAARTRVELEDVIGFFANTVPVRLRLGRETTCADLLASARDALRRALAGQHLPFDDLVERLRPAREMRQNPIFQCFFAFQNAPDRGLRLNGLSVATCPAEVNTAKFDLTLEVYDTPGQTGLLIEYNVDLFDRSTVDRFARHYLQMLRGCVERPGDRVWAVPLTSEAEHRRVAGTFNDTTRRYPGLGTLTEMLRAQAEHTPGAIAVAAPEGELTYRELAERADRLAANLRARGVGQEDVVGVCLERSLSMVVSLVGTLMAGGAYLPLDPSHPPERLRAIVRQARPKMVLSCGALAGLLPSDSGFPVILLDQYGWAASGQPDQPRPVAGVPHPDNLAYVIFTSGSTGTPKGVMVSHRAIANRLCWMQAEYGLRPDDRVLQKTPFTFDVSVWELFWPLTTGARLVVAPPRAHRDPEALAEVITRHRVTVAHFVPPMLAEFLVSRDVRLTSLPLRHIFCSGDVLPVDIVEACVRRIPAQLHNLYGPTEAAVDVTYHRCAPDAGYRSVPIGRLVGNTTGYVLDDHRQPVPVGVPGRLYLGGVQLARGYLGQPGLTACSFVPDPFAAEPGQRLYDTGDIVRWRDNGELEFLGRQDGQVKVRGFRVELDEVEAALRGHPEVDNAAAAMHHTAGRPDALVGYLVLRDPRPGGERPTQLSEWRAVWDQIHDSADRQVMPDPGYAGWVSSYTNQPIPPQEMAEFVDGTVARVRSLGGSRLLEIGVGGGLLLRRLASLYEEYWATDLSAASIETLRAWVAAAPALRSRVRLAQREAADFEGLPRDHFDGVVLNSIVQYFPDADYLASVVRGALALVREGGFVFLGDLRSLPLLRLFHAGVQATRLPRHTPAAAFRAMVDLAVRNERELVVDPAYFRQMAPDATVGHALRRGRFRNELTGFRFDVVLRRATAHPPRAVEYPWDDELDNPARLVARYAQRGDRYVTVRGVRNDRLTRDVAVLQWAASADGELAEGLASSLDGGQCALDPEDICREAEWRGLRAAVGWSATGPLGSFDVTLGPADDLGWLAPLPPPAPDAALTNTPNLAARYTRLEHELRDLLRQRLPDFMVPSLFRFLPELPLSPSGKLDRRWLPDPRGSWTQGRIYVPPRDATERAVAETWAEILGIDRVGRQDNFFDLGGDSILAIQVASRLRERGMATPLRAFFDDPTVAGVASATSSTPVADGTDAVSRPLTAIQVALLHPEARAAGPYVLRTTRQPRMSRDQLARTLRALARACPAVRLRVDAAAGSQRLTSMAEGVPALDWSGPVPTGQVAAAVRSMVARARAEVDVTRGPGLLLAVVDDPVADTQELVLAVDRLMVDEGCLAELLAAVEEGMTSGQVASRGTERDLDAVLRQLPTASPAGAAAVPSAGTRRTAGLRAVITLGRQLAVDLCDRLPGQFKTQVVDVLTAALGQTLAPLADQPDLRVDVDLPPQSGQLGQAVGPFGRRIQLDVPCGPVDADSFRAVKAGIRAAGQGRGPGRPLARRPRVLLRVTKSDDRTLGSRGHRWTWCGRDEGGFWPGYDLVVEAQVGEPFTVRVSTQPDGDREPDVLAQCYVSAVAQVTRSVLDRAIGGYVAADFPLLPLSDAALAALDAHPDLEEVYPLTPIQRHMVPRLASKPLEGLYTIVITLAPQEADFDPDAFCHAWKSVMARHPALRTSFLDLPGHGWTQVVHPDPPLPITRVDLGAEPQGQPLDLVTLAEQRERHHVFVLDQAPQWAMTMFRLDDGYRVVCRFSYALQDGWSFYLILEEAMTSYHAYRVGRVAELAPPPQVRDYFGWLAEQDRSAAERHWRMALRSLDVASGVRAAAGGLPPDPQNAAGGGAVRYAGEATRLDRLLAQRLRAFGRRHRLTLFTLLEAGWAMTLARLAGNDTVAFATVTAGRPPAIPEVERMVGPLNSVVPVVTPVPRDVGVVDWLRRLQYEHTLGRQYDHAALPDLRRWVGRTGHDPLVDSLLVFENFPRRAWVEREFERWGPDEGETQSEHPLRLLIWPAASMTIFASYYTNVLDAAQVRALLDEYISSLETLARCSS